MAVEESPNALVSVDELVNRMSDVSLTEHQMQDAAVWLIGLQRGLERWCNRRFTPGSVESERTFTDPAGYAMLRRSPVTSISSVKFAGIDPDDATELVGSCRATVNGIIAPYAGTWLRVTYEGGYVALDPDDLADVKTAILEKAKDAMTDNHDDTVSVKGLETRETPAKRPASATPQWTKDEKEQFYRLRRRVIL